MDKNTITGLALIGVVLIGFNIWSQPSQAEREEQASQDSIQQAAELNRKAAQHDVAQAPVAATRSQIFAANARGASQLITLQNDKVEVKIGTHGGTIESATVKGYKEYGSEQDVRLLEKETNTMELTLSAKAENIYLNQLYFTPAEQTDSTLTLEATAANGGKLSILYTLRPDNYVLDMEVKADGLANYFAPGENAMGIFWAGKLRQMEKGFSFENRYSQLTYKKKGDDAKMLSFTGKDRKDPDTRLDWVAFKTQFFSAVLIGQQDFKNAQLYSEEQEENSGYLKQYIAKMQTPFDATGKQPTQLQMYLGPNDFHTLKSIDDQSLAKENLDVEELVDFGWPVVKWINRYFILYLFDGLSALGLHMALVLLLLTLIVKALVFPANRKSYLSTARMRVLKPEVDKIAAKYTRPEDALKKQQETMQLYSSYGVSPMGGCLPMLIQMPIWIALFNFVPNAIELRGQSFLWADDLSAYDSLISWNTHLPLIGDHISIFCVLFSVTNILTMVVSMRQQQQSAMMSAEQEQQMKMMRWMSYLMPVVFFFTFNNYSAGLCYYYFLSALSSVLIMWALRKFTNEDKLLAQLKAYKEKNAGNPKKMSSLAARLEAMQKMAEEQQRRQQQK